MSDDLRYDIADALKDAIRARRRMGAFEGMADAILDGGIEVRPGVRIMAVEEYFRAYRMPADPNDSKHGPILGPYFTAPLYREVTDE